MNYRNFVKRGFAALLALLIVLTSVPMTNVFAAEDGGNGSSVEISVEESAISTSLDQETIPEESAETIELPDETGESLEEEETDPARAGPVEETVETSVEETVEETVEISVDETVEESAVLSEEEIEPGNVIDETFTADPAFGYASYDAFASERAGVALTRTERQIQFFNTFVDQAVLSGGATIDSLFGADNENYSAEYLLSLNPNQFTETTPVYIGADGNYYVVSAVQVLNGMESSDYQPATAFYNGISEAFTDIEYLGSGVYQIPAKRAEYCFSEHYYTDDAAGNIIGVTFGLRIQQLFGYDPTVSAERTIAADVLYPDASEKSLPATVNLISGTVTVKLFPDDYDIDLSSGYNLAAVLNKGESTPSAIQLMDGGTTAVFSAGDGRAVGCIDIAIAYQAPADPGVPMQVQARALRSAVPAKAALRGASSGAYSMYDSNYAEVDPDQLPSDLAVGDMFYFSTRLHVAGVYDNYDGGGNLHVGANSIPTHEAQSFTYYNELADWTVIKNWFATKLSDPYDPDPDTVAPGVMRQMTEANMLARAANNGNSVNLSGAKIFGYVSDPLGSNTTNNKTLDLSGISIAIGCMHAWAYMGSTAPADVVASIYQFTGTNSWAPEVAYGFFEPVVAMQCTEIRKEGNTTYATFKVVTQMLQIGNIVNPVNYQCGFATLRLAYEKEDTGYAKIVKSSGNTSVTDDNACYSLIGAEYTVYSDPDCTTVAKDVDGNDAVLKVQDEAGNTNTVELEAGGYYVKETKAGKGYFLNEETYPVTVKPGETTTVPVTDYPGLDPVNIILIKKDSVSDNPQGASYLEGAEYTVKYYDNQTGTGTPKKTWIFRTDSSGMIRYKENYRIGGDELYTGNSGYVGVPIGTITIQETRAPKGYILNNETYTVHFTQQADGTVRSDKGVWNAENEAEDLTIESEEPAVYAGIQVKKQDQENTTAQGDADFSGIEFTIRNGNGRTVNIKGTDYAANAVILTIASDADGIAKTSADALPVGTYLVQEAKTNDSYILTDGTARTVVISDSDNGKTVAVDQSGEDLSYRNTVKKGGIQIVKKDADNETAQGDGSLAGIRFAVVNDSAKAVKVNGADYEKGYVVTVLTLDENGTAATAENILPYGSYSVYELRKDTGVVIGVKYSDAPKGSSPYANDSYLFKANTKTLQVYENNKLYEAVIDNEIIRGGVKIEKWDKELQKKVAQGDADFNGIQFEITNRSAKAVKVNGTSYAKGDVVYTMTTNAAGDASTADDLLPYGTYSIQEVATNGSYLLTDGTAYTFQIRENGKIVDTDSAGNKITFEDEVIRGGVKVGKIDRETDTNEAQGWATLEGAEFTIYNNSEKPVVVDGVEYRTGSAVKTLVTSKDGTVESVADLLPYGTYYIKETKAPEGYLLNSKWRVDFQIRENGKIVDTTDDSAPDEIKRADLKFAKYDIDGRKMAGIPFLVSRLDRDGNIVESHAVVTDENGKLNTKNLSKTDEKVNSLDSYVKDGVFTDDTKLDSSVGVWFGEQSARDDSRGSLIYANYRISELSCKANEGQDLLTQDLFLQEEVEDLVNVFENNHVYDLESIFTDLIIHPESDLLDKTTDSKSVTLGENVIVTDTVRYDHLKTYKLYKIETEIVYVSREGQKKISLGTGSKEFYPEKADATDTANGTVVCEVQINTKGLNGGAIHAVDTFYVKMEDDWVKLITHNEDLSDERQTLYVPYMETEAADAKTNDHVGTIEAEAEINDIVTYENLANDRLYKLVGTLRYADTGEAVKGTDGNDCIVETVLRVSYRATKVTEKSYGYLGPKDGEIRMPAFEFDASAMAGRTLVVTENLYDYDTDELIISHEELTDEKQSVHYIKVTTEAKDSKTGTRTATVGENETITDTVTLTNTIPDMTYVVTGNLVYQKDCIDAAGSTHKKGDVISSHDPVSVTAKGSMTVVKLQYSVDSSLLEGISGVVFEEVYHNDIEIVKHHDFDAEPQTPHWPKVRTSAVDGDTKGRTGVVGDTSTIVDTVTLSNLNIGDTYKVSGILMQQDGTVFTVNGKAVSAESEEFTAESSAETHEISFTFSSSGLAGKSLVVFEKLYCNGIDVAHHEDLTDKDQTVDYPEGRTNANDGKTKDEVGTVGETETIIDTVTYRNLHIGDTYTISGTLHYLEDFTDKDGVKHLAGEMIVGEDGKAITASETFIAKQKDGSIDLVYTLNSELLRGTSVVVFEDLINNSVKVYRHADLEDEDQRVDYPKVGTTAVDSKTEDNVGAADKIEIVDTVALTNLTIGKVYKVTGILMDKETGEALVDENGNEITSESEEFEATETNMTIEMTFVVNVDVAGKTTVVFEDLIHNGVVVSYHHDIEDEGQSVHYPEIGTTATADDTEDHVSKSRKEMKITDTVHFRNLLTDGREYTVKGILMDKETGNPILIDGEEVIAEKTFVPEDNEGDVEIVFTFNAFALAGTTLVAFETLEYKGIEVAVHADINDEAQTIYIPEIRTKAYDGETQIDHSRSGKVTLYDQVTFTNLLPEKDYVMKGYLVDKLTGEPILQNGKKVTAEKEFCAEAESGVVIMEFTFDGELISPEPIVVFESLYYKDIEVAVHTDIEDEEQSDYIPEISTTAKDSETEDHIALADEEVTITDTVDYQGLKPDTKYVVKGILMDKETGKELLDANGKTVTAEQSFVTGKCIEGEASISGSIALTFKFDGSLLAGKTAVVFERLYQSDKEVAVHTDIEDEDQTIHFPDAKTTATDAATETHTAHLDEKVTMEDEVFYTNLIPGKKYTVKGMLMVKDTGKPLLDKEGKEITIEKTFTAEKADGSILLTFENIDTTNLVGKSIVAFEKVYYEGIEIIVHADIEDEDQTVVVPEIRTTAADKASGGKTMTLGDEVTLVDTVSFTGLTPGEEYILKGKVMDKTKGEVLKEKDKEVVTELRFVPESTDGSVCMEFIINTNNLKDHELVVFEKLYDLKGNSIAEHEDLEDQEQTVKVPTEPPKEPPKVIITGDENRPGLYFALIGISAAALMVLSMLLVHFRKREK